MESRLSGRYGGRNVIELLQYRDKWMFEKVDDYIGFYPREFYCLDNFSAFGVEYQGVYYQTVEHAYQSLSFLGADDKLAETIRNCHSAHEAQKKSHDNKSKRASDWDNRKLLVMGALLREKVKQHPYVMKKLMETGSYLIVEDSPKDDFWGIGADRKGENYLGKLWMKIRDDIEYYRNTKSFGIIDCR